MRAPSTWEVRILLIEEDPILRDIFLIGLQSHCPGWIVYAPDNVKEAVRLVQKTELAMVIMDLDMSDNNGMQIMNDIRRVSDVPILLLGVSRDIEMKEKLHTTRMVDYMTKPFTPYAFSQQVKEIVNNSSKTTSSRGISKRE